MTTNFDNISLSTPLFSLLIKDLTTLLDCPVDLEKFTNPKMTPCGHTIDQKAFSKVFAHGSLCPIDRTPITSKDLRLDLFTQRISELKITKVFFKINTGILELDSKIIKNRLDDRAKLLGMFYCPISKKIIETPVTGLCGHTFDSSSVKIGSSCPHDQTDITQGTVMNPYLAKNILDTYKKYSAFGEIPPDEQEQQITLFMNGDRPVRKIINIATSLGVTPVKTSDSPLLCNGKPIENMDLSLSKLPLNNDNGLLISGFFGKL